MKPKFFPSFILILTLIFISACSGSVTPSATANAPTQASTSDNLGIGLLKLEGSALQVTAAQADDLLLLWKGVKLLTSDKSSSAIELAALFEQIQDNLTSEQLAAIRATTWTQGEIAEVIQKYADPSVATPAKKTSSSSSSTSGMAGGPGGGPGGPGGDMAMIMGGGSGSGSSSSETSAQAKAIAASKNNPTAASLNAQLADAIIALLKQRVNG